MQPEISRRCLVCGASPRAGAHFCPQCGSSLTDRAGGAEVPGADVRSDAPDAARDEAAGGGEEVARAFEAWRGGEASAEDVARALAAGGEKKSAGEAPSSAGAGDESRTQTAGEVSRPAPTVVDEMSKTRRPVMPEPLAAKSAPVADEDEAEGASSAAKLAGAVGATRRRAASVMKESIGPRVERVRDRSLVMMEEAPDDSGLRFVLLAALMFALFILLLVLSTVIK